MPKYEVQRSFRAGDTMIQQNPRPEVNGKKVVELTAKDAKEAVGQGWLKEIKAKKKAKK